MTRQHPDGLDLLLSTAPRRRVLRSLAGAVMGLVGLVGVAGCGGDDEDEEEEDEDDD